MDQTGQGAGVSTETATPQTSAAQAPQGDAQVPATQARVVLDQLPDFRRYQGERDRREAQLQRELQAREQQLRDLEGRIAAIEGERLDQLDPAEQVAALKRQMEAQRAKQVQEAEQMQITQQAFAIVQAAGLDWNDPRLTEAKAVGPTMQGVMAISQAVAKALADDARAARDAAEQAKVTAEERAKTQVQKAEVQALNNAGVTATSPAVSVVAPSNPREQAIAQFRAKRRAFIGRGIDAPGWLPFLTDLKNAGLTLDDVS
jgi:hypothetical protein